LKYKTKFLSLAIEDKEEVKQYLSQFYPSTYRKFTGALKIKLTNLKENPYMYAIYPENPNYRHIIVGNYLLLYRIIENDKKVEIIRILRASWNISDYI